MKFLKTKFGGITSLVLLLITADEILRRINDTSAGGIIT